MINKKCMSASAGDSEKVNCHVEYTYNKNKFASFSKNWQNFKNSYIYRETHFRARFFHSIKIFRI